MIKDLEKLLSRAHSPCDNTRVSAIAVMKDGTSFSGVIIKNVIFRDAIYAEQAAIARAAAKGYRYGDFKELQIMANLKDIADLKHINHDVIIEFMEPNASIFLYDINHNPKELKVSDLSL